MKNLLYTMILAALGSFHPNAPCSRSVGLIPNTKKLIITDAYVGVCCNAMKKVCEILKSKILRPRNEVVPPGRDTHYDGAVHPLYGRYPHNAIACMRIVDPSCNPPAALIKRWIQICHEASVERGGGRALCLEPIDLDATTIPW